MLPTVMTTSFAVATGKPFGATIRSDRPPVVPDIVTLKLPLKLGCGHTVSFALQLPLQPMPTPEMVAPMPVVGFVVMVPDAIVKPTQARSVSDQSNESLLPLWSGMLIVPKCCSTMGIAASRAYCAPA